MLYFNIFIIFKSIQKGLDYVKIIIRYYENNITIVNQKIFAQKNFSFQKNFNFAYFLKNNKFFFEMVPLKLVTKSEKCKLTKFTHPSPLASRE